MEHIEQATDAPGEMRDLPSHVLDALRALMDLPIVEAEVRQSHRGHQREVTITIIGRTR